MIFKRCKHCGKPSFWLEFCSLECATNYDVLQKVDEYFPEGERDAVRQELSADDWPDIIS